MKKILVCLTALLAGTTFAQSTFTTANKTGNGTYPYFVCDSVGGMFNVKGNGVTWDYSGIQRLTKSNASGDSTASYMVGLVPQSDTFGFTAANKLINTGSFTADYLNATTNDVREGVVITDNDFGLIIAKFTTKPEIMSYPLAFGDTILSNSVGTASPVDLGMTDKPLAGKHYTIYDGFGTLKVGSITYSDVSRVFAVDSFKVDTEDPNVGIIDVVLTQVKYYTLQTITEPVFIYNQLDIILDPNDPNGAAMKNYTLSLDQTVGVKNLSNNNFSIYPNPASETVQLKGDFENTSVKIINQLGQVVLEKTVSTNQSIDLKELQSGIYFINAVLDGQTVTQKLIKD